MCRPKSCAGQARTHHAIDDGMGIADTLGGKLLHVLVDLRGQSAEFVRAHVLRACWNRGLVVHAEHAENLAKLMKICQMM